MKIQNYTFPKSSFLSLDKDIEILVNLFLKNERLKKLLYYDTQNALEQPNVPQDKSIEMFGKQIKIVPKLRVDKPEFCYIIISFDNFTPNLSNPAYRDNVISFDVVCHFDQWNLGNFALRPYKIAAEIDSMINNKKLTGIGTIQFIGANQIVLSDEFAGFTLMYQTIHGYKGEDSKDALNPLEQQDIETNWNQIFNTEDGL